MTVKMIIKNLKLLLERLELYDECLAVHRRWYVERKAN